FGRCGLSRPQRVSFWARTQVCRVLVRLAFQSDFRFTGIVRSMERRNLRQNFRAMYSIRALVNRCGVISGPWQMGKADQGLIVHWMAQHLFGGSLTYMGFGGEGLQVLHIDDLYDLLSKQLAELDRHSRQTVYSVGGGMENSVSLRELTGFCRELSGKRIQIGRIVETRDA